MRQVGPTFFSDRSPVISREQSLRIVAGLRAIGMLDGEGHVTADPSVEDVSRGRSLLDGGVHAC